MVVENDGTVVKFALEFAPAATARENSISLASLASSVGLQPSLSAFRVLTVSKFTVFSCTWKTRSGSGRSCVAAKATNES